MKQSLLVAIAAAAIGAATAVLLTAQTPPPARSPAPARAVNAAALELAFVRALDRMGFGGRARSLETPVTAPGPVPASTRAAMPPTRRAQDPAPLPPPDRAVVESVDSFEKDEQLRRTWMFRSEREVIEWLGAPDRAWPDSSAERWVYKRGDGRDLTLEFHRGRLLNIFR